jgi:hypothetical protein
VLISTDTAGWIESIGAACAAIGTVLAVGVALWQSRSQDRNINKRERQNDLRGGVDRAIASLVGGDHAAQRYIARVGAGEPQTAVMVAADDVSAREIEMRAAAASLEFRLGPSDAMVQVLDEARAYFVAAYVATGPALIEKLEGPEAVADATTALDEFRKRYERVVEMARERFGPDARKLQAPSS